MPDKCCVPNCYSNYASASTISGTSSTYVTTFHFPKDDESKQQWVKSIRRESFIPSKHSVVCIKHFTEACIVKVDRMTRDDGSILEIDRSRPKLTKNAVPSIFPKIDDDYVLPKKKSDFAKIKSSGKRRKLNDTEKEWPKHKCAAKSNNLEFSIKSKTLKPFEIDLQPHFEVKSEKPDQEINSKLYQIKEEAEFEVVNCGTFLQPSFNPYYVKTEISDYMDEDPLSIL